MTLLVVVVLLIVAVLVSRPHRGDGADGPDGASSSGRALVVGDSVVALAARTAGVAGPVRLIGYPGLTPDVFGGTSSSLLAQDLAAAGRPRTVVLNWNGNNPRQLLGTALVADYRAELTGQIRWYLGHGVTRVVLAAAVPSLLNDSDRQVDWTSPDSARPGEMLGSSRLNAMYRQLAGTFGDSAVRYSERAARAIHPSMTFNTTLDGHPCIIDFVHPTPYCAARYARALADLAHHPDRT